MEYSQAVILVAATLALVAIGMTHATGGFGLGKLIVATPDEPCALQNQSNEVCDKCCRQTPKYKSGLVDYRQECACYYSDMYAEFSKPAPWREA